MNRKATVFFYFRDPQRPESELQKALEEAVLPDRLETCDSLPELSARLRSSMADPAIVVLFASDRQDLHEVVKAGAILGDARIILILPDRENDTVALGHRLRPRFISYKDENLYEIAAVLKKMLEKTGTPKMLRFQSPSAGSVKYPSYRSRGRQMETGYETPFQTRRLPPFIYNRGVHLKERDLNEIIGGMESTFSQQDAARIDFKTALTGESLPVMADAARLREVLLHLVRNAKDSMPSGGVLTLGTRKIGPENRPAGLDQQLSGPCALCSISDTGIGMDEETRARVLEPFFTKKEHEGKGLGLPIAHHIVRQHNGSMVVESRPGRGTTVNIYLPLLTGRSFESKPIPLTG